MTHHLRSCRNFSGAFTLAEVLITLGIIGVVTALTMPSLIANHKKHVVEVRLAKFYSTMNQVVKLAVVDHGEVSTWDSYELTYEKDEEGNNDLTKPLTNMDFFQKYFVPYMNSLKIEDIPNSTSILVHFSDSSIAFFSPYSIIFFPYGKDYYSMNKNNEHKKYVGTKCFTFFFNKTSGIEPYKDKWDGTKETLLNDNSLGCKKEEVTNERAYCTMLIQLNGWKIPKDYPLKF